MGETTPERRADFKLIGEIPGELMPVWLASVAERDRRLAAFEKARKDLADADAAIETLLKRAVEMIDA